MAQPPGGEPDILALAAQEDPELLNDAILLLAERQGVPPEQVAADLEAMPVPERNRILAGVLQELLAQYEQEGPPPGGPMPADMPAPPLPPGPMPPGAGPPGMMGGPPLPGGPLPPPSPPLLEGPPDMGGPSPLPVAPEPPAEEDYLADVDEDEVEPEPPDDWEPEALDDLYGKGYAWKAKPDHEEICQLAKEALDDQFWQDRNEACYDQAWCYYRSRNWTKLNGLPLQQMNGELLYMLSTPATNVDRIVERSQPFPENLTFSLPPRADIEEYQDAAQYAENFCRDLWAKFCRQWQRNLSQTRPGRSLPGTMDQLSVLHGAVAYSIRPDFKRRKGNRKRDINAHQPIILDVIPQHEVYLLGDITLRIQSVTLKEARRLSPEVRKRWPSRPKDERDTAEWMPSDDHPSRLISGSDIHGKWYFQCFDLCLTDTQRGQLPKESEPQHWTIAPQEINFGRCLFQLPPGWQSTADNALPDDRQAAENYGRNFARGVLFSQLNDFAVQDQIASAALSTFLYNRDPMTIDRINYELRKKNEQDIPDHIKVQMGKREQRDVSEGFEFVPKPFADNAGDNFLISMAFGQTANTYPAALGGGGQAQSGYDRRQMVENAQLLHVDALRRYAAQWVAQLMQDCLELLYRCMDDTKSTFSDLPFRLSAGGVGEVRLKKEHLERAGVDIEVEYFEEDVERDLRLNNIYLPRLASKVNSLQTTREKLGTPEPDREEERVDAEFALTHPTMQMGRAMLALKRNNHPLFPFLELAAQMEKQQQQGGPPGMPGMPSPPGVPPGGGEPSVERGLPPGMPVPNVPGM